MTDIYRPRFHFSAKVGWINDPNGLIVVDGVYHLFFQHNPNGPVLGPQHWGHARSDNLTDWEECPVALYPQGLGQCWSGSAIEMADGEIKLFYTEHSETPAGGREDQRLVHADRAMTDFRREPANPVIPYPGTRAFRDPKVIWHGPTQRWIMVLTHGRTVGFYSSANLIDWRLESEFGEDEIKLHNRVWECPDLISMTDEDGDVHWVLALAAGGNALGDGLGTRYIVGTFDGKSFVSYITPDQALWLDHGPDYYAAQSFFDRRGGQPVTMAWASNWAYAQRTPTEGFRGVLSCPRELRLVATASGLRIRQSAQSAFHQRLASSPPSSGSYLLEHVLDLAVSDIANVYLFGEDHPQFTITRSGQEGAIIRVIRRDTHDIGDFACDYEIELTYPQDGCLPLEIYVDNGLVEFCANRGEIWVTCLHYPADISGAARIEIERGKDAMVA